tara:strand:- start:141 stop:452 length:312 start_codon:yes stop_codon:yes gene_type:complete
MYFENENGEVLMELGDDVDADDYVNPGSDGEINVSSKHPNFQRILSILEKLNTTYLDDKQKIINTEDFKNLTKTEDVWTLTICELEPASRHETNLLLTSKKMG